jgi:MoaA/NifB/PqqE/SkfB family radical SAM enzyme
MSAAIEPHIAAAYDASRELSQAPFASACFAPFVSLTFDTLGVVRACCQHSRHHPLGKIPEQSLDEIWNGEAVQQLRSALRDYNFDRGCGFCKWQVMDGNYLGVFARHYDWLADDGRWPRVMEFMISNTCNLECVMCCGEWSHLIRARREKAPPLPKVYDDRFFNDLRRYLPHLKLAKFAGGEPFLSRESYRIWEMMEELGLQTHCFVTTNGTIYNAKVEAILERFPTDLAISMDGISKETFENIRVNAVFEVFSRNISKFRDYVARRGTTMNINYCLQRKNWHEFGEFLEFADSLDATAFVCTVTQPRSESIYTLAPHELRSVVESMEARNESMVQRLGKNRGVWIEELGRLKHRLEKHQDEPAVYSQVRQAVEQEGGAEPTMIGRIGAAPSLAARRAQQAREELRRWAGHDQVQEVVADFDDRIRQIHLDASLLERGVALPAVGDAAASLMMLIMSRYGDMALDSQVQSVLGEERVFHLGADRSMMLRAVTIPDCDEQGETTGRRTLFALRAAAI